MKRFTTFVALFVCTMIISGSVVQLRAQGPTAVGGGGGAVAPTKVESGAVQILNCWMSRPGPNTPDYNLKWEPSENPTVATCRNTGNNCKKICEFRNQGTVEPTDYGYKLSVTLDGTEYTRNTGTKVSGEVPQPGTVIGPGECIVRIDLCPGAPELESLQLDFVGLTVAEGGTVTMMIPYIR